MSSFYGENSETDLDKILQIEIVYILRKDIGYFLVKLGCV